MGSNEKKAVDGKTAPADHDESDEQHSELVLVDELAVLAADLWFSGKLDRPLGEEPDDAFEE